jgi:hypothetical protein
MKSEFIVYHLLGTRSKPDILSGLHSKMEKPPKDSA